MLVAMLELGGFKQVKWARLGVARSCSKARSGRAKLLDRNGRKRPWHGRATKHGVAVPKFCPSTVQVEFCAVCELAFGLIWGCVWEGVWAWKLGQEGSLSSDTT